MPYADREIALARKREWARNHPTKRETTVFFCIGCGMSFERKYRPGDKIPKYCRSCRVASMERT